MTGTAGGSSRRNKAGGKGGRLPTNIGGSGRCCICFDPVALQNVAVIAFFCTHAYHETCLNDTSGIASAEDSGNLKRSESTIDDATSMSVDNGDASGPAPMRCILCTTAASTKRKAEANGYDRTVSTSERTSPGWGSGDIT